MKDDAVFSYINFIKKIGSLVKVSCGTDFVTGNEMFQQLDNDLVMHIAVNPASSIEEVLAQPFLKDLTITVDQHIKNVAAKFNESMKLTNFFKLSI